MERYAGHTARFAIGVSDVPEARFSGDDEPIDVDLLLMHEALPQDALAPPSAWVVRWSALIPKGSSVLDLACGNGRHMQCLSAMGLEVTGVDKNQTALQVAGRFGTALEADLEAGPWPFFTHQFDAVIVTNYLWRPLFSSIQDCIKPGGWLIYETFATGNESLGKPSNPAFLLNTLELITAFAQLTPVAYENGLVAQPPRIIQRICAFKPTNSHNGSSMPPLVDSLKCAQTTRSNV